MRKTLALVACLASAASLANAAPNLTISEVWVGGLDGSEATSDWFEITNFGDMDATGLDGTLFYDDNSFDATKNDPLTGIDTIAAGESVIYLVSWEDDFVTAENAITAFEAMWGPPAGDLSGLQIGVVEGGSGLGGGGDAAAVYDGNTEEANLISSAQYGAPAGDNVTFASFIADKFGDYLFPTLQSQIGVDGAYEGNLPASDGLIIDEGVLIDEVDIPNAVGSPGTATAPVPEPSSIVLGLFALVGLGMAARR